MLSEEKELLAALLRLFIVNPTGNPLTRGQMMEAAKIALSALTTTPPEAPC